MKSNHVLTIDGQGILVLPPELLEQTGWDDTTVLQWDVSEGCATVRACERIPREIFEKDFDLFFNRVAQGETIVIECEEGKDLIFTPYNAELTSLI